MAEEMFNQVKQEDPIPMPEYHMYVCEKSPNFRIRLIDGPPDDVYAEFMDGVFKTTDDNIAAVFDKLIATKINISALVRKVEWTEMAKAVRRARDTYAKQHATVKGAMTSQAQNEGLGTHSEDIRTRMEIAGVPQEKIEGVIKGLADSGLPIVNQTDANEIGAAEKAKDAQIVRQPTITPPKKALTFGKK